jgi:hypothetical protein
MRGFGVAAFTCEFHMTLRYFLGRGKDVLRFNNSSQNMASAIVAVQAEGGGRKCCQVGARA